MGGSIEFSREQEIIARTYGREKAMQSAKRLAEKYGVGVEMFRRA